MISRMGACASAKNWTLNSFDGVNIAQFNVQLITSALHCQVYAGIAMFMLESLQPLNIIECAKN